MKKSTAITWGIILTLIAFPLGPLIFYLICKDKIIDDEETFYSTNEIRGSWNESFRIENAHCTEKDLRDEILICLDEALKKNNVPAEIFPASISSRKYSPSSAIPMLIIKNTQPENIYFDLGIVVNLDVLSFPVFGNSKENYRKNMYTELKDKTDFFSELKKSFYTPDVFKLERETIWRQDVLKCFKQFFS